jgi:hypothetical protein
MNSMTTLAIRSSQKMNRTMYKIEKNSRNCNLTYM